LAQNPKKYSLRLHDQEIQRFSLVCGKNWLKLCISLSWSTYSESVIHNGMLHKFLWILKKINFCSKFNGVSFRFYRKTPCCGKIDWNSIFLSCEVHIPYWLYIMVYYMIFYGFFFKNQLLAQNVNMLAFCFTENVSLRQK
jgi:hypothetical protein